MEKIGLKVPKSGIARSLNDAREWGEKLTFPIIVRPAFTLGGTGGGVAYNKEDLERIAQQGLAASLTTEVMLEESLLGWKEFELEVVRDKKDNCVIICSIENLDPMGVHTGDSVTVAPAQTLTDDEYQKMRDASLAIMREIGVETGGSNVQFALNPANGEMMIIEMNPGFPGLPPWPPRPRVSPSPRSQPSWPWATPWTNCRTTSPARPWPLSSRP